MSLAAGKSAADLLMSSLLDPQQQQLQQQPQLALSLVPGERVSEGARAVAAQALQDRLQRHIDEQVHTSTTNTPPHRTQAHPHTTIPHPHPQTHWHSLTHFLPIYAYLTLPHLASPYITSH